jgi:hypothetical protein
MSAQAVARLFLEEDVCPHCGTATQILYLTLVVAGLEAERPSTRTGCLRCLEIDSQQLEIRDQIRVKDVIDLPTKARHRETRRLVTKRESEAAADIGGSSVSGSGSGISKGDARNSNWMVEDKVTTGKTFTLRREVLSKAIKQAGSTGRRPVVRVGLSDGTELAVCLWDDMKEVIREDDQSS